jgi:hypothetical protein
LIGSPKFKLGRYRSAWLGAEFFFQPLYRRLLFGGALSFALGELGHDLAGEQLV